MLGSASLALILAAAVGPSAPKPPSWGGEVVAVPAAVVDSPQSVPSEDPSARAASPMASLSPATGAPGPRLLAPVVRFDGRSGDAATAAAAGGLTPASMAVDTPAPPPPPIEYSDAYYTRLQIHKWASWAMLPLFAAQYASGQDLVKNGRDAASWARDIHGPAATGVAALFAVNTVTGAWNLWEGRKDPYGRKWRTAHGVLMLLADAGFVATGMLAGDAGENSSTRSAHKTVAITSMGIAVSSWLMMLPPFRRE